MGPRASKEREFVIARAGRIDTAAAAEAFRRKIIDTGKRKILVTNYIGTEQEKDLSEPPNCKGFGRIRHFKRATTTGWPRNPLPIDPASQSLSLGKLDSLRAQVFQNAACAWRCWYCFVPYSLLSGDSKEAAWLSAEEIVDLYLAETDRPLMIDLTGGSPDLTPEWVIWMMQALIKRGIEDQVFLWSDDNLSTDYLWRYVSPEDLQLMREYRNYGRVACFKGFDDQSFAFNTKANSSDFDKQFEIMRRLISTGLDCYAYATFTTDDARGIAGRMKSFVDRLQQIDEQLPLRTVPLRIEAFTPVHSRITAARTAAISLQDEAIAAWNSEVEARFSRELRDTPIWEIPCGPRTKNA
jgi:uncharacterized Fe-S cluster-containing radical SAM superfamily protein